MDLVNLIDCKITGTLAACLRRSIIILSPYHGNIAVPRKEGLYQPHEGVE